MPKDTLSVVSGVLFLLAFVPYATAILRGKAKPEKATWLIWASMDTVLIAGMFAKGTVNGQIAGAVLGAWVTVALALKYGIPGWTKTDKWCLAGTILGIAAWAAFRNPTFGIVVICAVGILGSIPMFQEAWRDPTKEDKLAWTIWWLSCVAAVLAIPQWTIADAAQPLTFTLIESTMMYLLFIQPRLRN